MSIQLDELIASVRAADTNIGSAYHGETHWKCVAHVGLTLAPSVPDVDREIIFLFGLFHDSQRFDDGHDLDHGRRAAALVSRLHGQYFQLERPRLDLLIAACAGHVDTDRSSNATIGLCWDADRLNLWRVGIAPLPKFLSTSIARQPETIKRFQTLDGKQFAWKQLCQRAAGS